MAKLAARWDAVRQSRLVGAVGVLLMIAGQLSTLEWLVQKVPALATIPDWMSSAAFIVGLILLFVGLWSVGNRVRSLDTSAGRGPEARVRAIALRPMMGEIDGKPQVGFVMRVFNGNTYPVRLVARRKRLFYGDRVVTNFIMTGVGDDGLVSGLWDQQVTVSIPLEGPLGAEITADFKAGALKVISTQEMEIEVQDGQRTGLIEHLGRAVLVRKDDWMLGS
ncbi:MAG: hypothetical protein ABL982_20550 [Vicinamibacterales bacterium]